MSYDRYRVSIEVLENGLEVEVPDMEEIAKRRKEAAKKSNAKGDCCPSLYFGDCTKKYAAKSVKEALGLITKALNQIPEDEYDAAFDEAAGKK